MWLPQIPRTLLLTTLLLLLLLLKRSFKALLLQIIPAAFREQGKRLVPVLAPCRIVRSVWAGCGVVTAEFRHAISCFQLCRTSNRVSCPGAGHWTEQPETHSALPPRPSSFKDHLSKKEVMQKHVCSIIPVLGRPDSWRFPWALQMSLLAGRGANTAMLLGPQHPWLSWSSCVAGLVFCFERTPWTLAWRVRKGSINRMRGKSF